MIHSINLSKPIIHLLVLGTITGCRPFNKSTPYYNLYKTFLILLFTSMKLGQFFYILTNLNDIERLSIASCFFIGASGGVIKMYHLDRNFRLIAKISKELSKNVTFQPRNYIELRILKDGLFLSNRIYKLFRVLVTLTLIIYMSFPYAIKGNKLPIDIWTPYDLQKFYKITYLGEIIYASIQVYGIVWIDCLFTVLTIQIGAQCQLLNYRISDLDSDLSETRMKLTFCIEHHQEIIGW